MTPYNIMSRLLYRDALMLVVDKPAGLAVHADRRGGETLTDHLDDLRFGLPRRPEIVHRLDRETSGCLVLGRHARALARLNDLFRANAVDKVYWALVENGPPAEAGEIDLALAPETPRAGWRMHADPAGQPALTRWRVLGRGADTAWLELRPVTGRTHQLRVHCAAQGWPIRGDAIYGVRPGAGHQSAGHQSAGHPDAGHLAGSGAGHLAGSGAGQGSRERAARSGLMLHAQSVTLKLYPKKPAITVEAPAPERMLDGLAACGFAPTLTAGG